MAVPSWYRHFCQPFHVHFSQRGKTTLTRLILINVVFTRVGIARLSAAVLCQCFSQRGKVAFTRFFLVKATSTITDGTILCHYFSQRGKTGLPRFFMVNPVLAFRTCRNCYSCSNSVLLTGSVPLQPAGKKQVDQIFFDQLDLAPSLHTSPTIESSGGTDSRQRVCSVACHPRMLPP